MTDERLPHIGIVGHEAAKFTPAAKATAQAYIRNLLAARPCVVVSGHCHLGGIDIWAEEAATELGLGAKIFPPSSQAWATGYKPRNIRIAQTSDIVYCLVVKQFPAEYRGRRFPYCYHCKTFSHIKSGGCWTAWYAQRLGKQPSIWVEIESDANRQDVVGAPAVDASPQAVVE